MFLFGAVKLTKNFDILDMVLDLMEMKGVLFSSGGFGQNIIIFGVDMSSSVHVWVAAMARKAGRRVFWAGKAAKG